MSRTDDLKNRMRELQRYSYSKPITPVQNGYGIDEDGNLFQIRSEEEMNQRRIQTYKKRDKRPVSDRLRNKLIDELAMTPDKLARILEIYEETELSKMGAS